MLHSDFDHSWGSTDSRLPPTVTLFKRNRFLEILSCAFGVALLPLSGVLSVDIAPALAINQDILIALTSKQQLLLNQAKLNFASNLEQLDTVGESLNRKKTAHQLFGGNLKDSTPKIFIKQATVELDILGQLMETNNLLGEMVTVLYRLANGEQLKTTFGEVRQKFVSFDQDLGQLQETLRDHRDARKAFKLRLNSQVDDWIAAQPAKTSTFLAIKIALDPGSLDLDLRQQRTIISSVLITLQALQ